MSRKIGRNDPCPCGSGRKYKQCHGRDAGADAAAAAGHEGAGRRALEWLANRHRRSLERETLDLLYEDLWPEDGPHPEDVEPELMAQVLANLNEWMLAHGEVEVGRQWQDINALVCDAGGPPLNPAQREFIRQMGLQPLGLWSVREVREGEGVVLADVLARGREPVFVHDCSLSDTACPGLLIGCRVLELDGRHELSGALYAFPDLGGAAAIDAVRQHLRQEMPEEDRGYEQGWAIMAEWLRQVLLPQPAPELVDASTGEPLLFVTDHYRVVDRDALRATLDGCPELEAGADGSWVKLLAGDDGARRAALQVNPGKVASRLEVFYRTRTLADQGRPWFEALAGTAVKHLSREETDPVEMLRGGVAAD